MNVSSLRFALISLALVTGLCALHYFTFDAIVQQATNPYFMLVYVFLGLVYWLSYHWIVRAMNKSPRQFVNTFMLISVSRMLATLLLLIPVLMKNKENGTGKWLVIYFVAGYFIFLVTEIVILFKVSKRTT